MTFESLQQLNIEDLIPHRAPMVLIDKLIAYQADHVTAQVTIEATSPYFDDALNGVPNYVGIEYMAQTIAALAGIEAKQAKRDIRLGFLLGSRKLVLNQNRYQLDHIYQIHVQRLYQEESGLAVFECKITEQDDLIASANVNVFQPQDTQAYITDNV